MQTCQLYCRSISSVKRPSTSKTLRKRKRSTFIAGSSKQGNAFLALLASICVVASTWDAPLESARWYQALVIASFMMSQCHLRCSIDLATEFTIYAVPWQSWLIKKAVKTTRCMTLTLSPVLLTLRPQYCDLVSRLIVKHDHTPKYLFRLLKEYHKGAQLELSSFAEGMQHRVPIEVNISNNLNWTETGVLRRYTDIVFSHKTMQGDTCSSEKQNNTRNVISPLQ